MADTMLSFNDNSLSTDFLSMDDLRKACPAAFKTSPTNPNVSERYVHANTATVVEDLAKLGWYPTEAKQCRPKKNSSGIRSYHMIALQNPEVKICKPVTDSNGNVTSEEKHINGKIEINVVYTDPNTPSTTTADEGSTFNLLRRINNTSTTVTTEDKPITSSVTTEDKSPTTTAGVGDILN